MAKQIVVARHGHFEFFTPGQPLSDEGKAQAGVLAQSISSFLANDLSHAIIVASFMPRADTYAAILAKALNIASTSSLALGNLNGVAKDCEVIIHELELFTSQYAAVILVTHSPTTYLLPPYFGAQRDQLLNVTSKDFDFPPLDMGEAYAIHTETGDVIRLPK